MALDIKVFSGNSNPALAEKIVQNLKIPLGKAKVSHFSDCETLVEILEHVRGKEIYIVQSTSAPANEYLMEMVIMADALRRASAVNLTAVIPYFGYARQDRRIRSARVPITAKVVADMLTSVGITRVITVDLHAEQIQGFFSIPVDNVFATSVMLDDVRRKHYEDWLVVSPDVGGVVRARAFAKRLNDSDLAIIDKRRPQPNHARVMHVIGDVSGRDCILVDDIVDTAGTLCQAAKALKDHGAKKIVAYCTHPVLSGDAVKNINESELDEIVVTDSIPLSEAAKQSSKIKQLSLANMLGETIYRVNQKESLSSMFGEE